MSATVVRQWLGLSDQAWPPDDYTLLGLTPGNADAARVEQRVQDCMTRLRCYQLSHPAEASEGMNRVAQAYIHLTEALAKQAEKPPSTNGDAPGAKAENWQTAPPPVRTADDGDIPVLHPVASSPPVAALTAPSSPTTPAQPTTPSTLPRPAPPVDPVVELAQHSPQACRGLATLPALIDRIDRTRQLLVVWQQAGRYVGNPGRKLLKAAEETELTRRLRKIYSLMSNYPHILGRPGAPGYRVVAMARLDMTALMFKSLDAPQRKELARDWEAGQRVLLCHRKLLRRRFKELRHRSLPGRLWRTFRNLINDHPVAVGFGALAVAALVVWLFMRRH